MDYLSAAETAEKWKTSLRQVQRLLAAGRIPRAKKCGNSWIIPADAEKPGDPRFAEKSLEKPVADELVYFVEAFAASVLPDHPDAALDAIADERVRLLQESVLAYLRGDYEKTIQCFQKTKNDDSARLAASSITIAAAISTGDYNLYSEIEAFLKETITANKDSVLSAYAEIALATAYTGALAPNMVADWLKDGDFSALHPLMKMDAAYKRAKYFQSLGQFELMLSIAQTALAFGAPENGSFYFFEIYFPLVCAMAYCSLGREEEARSLLSDVMKRALPHGFITPFAESMTSFGGLLEQCLEHEFPEYHDAAINQWKQTFSNWMAFHNRFTKDNITTILSRREIQVALSVAQHVPRTEIAKQLNLSRGGLNNIIEGIYSKLLVHNRDELAKYLIVPPKKR